VDANKSADEDENYEKTEEEVEIGSSRRYYFEKESRLSRTVEFSEGGRGDEDQDSSNRPLYLEASRVCRRPVDSEMLYDFNHPVQGVTPEQQQATDDFVIQLEEIKRLPRPCTTASACKPCATTAMADQFRLAKEEGETCEACFICQDCTLTFGQRSPRHDTVGNHQQPQRVPRPSGGYG
jgi:hypothetical protein